MLVCALITEKHSGLRTKIKGIVVEMEQDFIRGETSQLLDKV